VAGGIAMIAAAIGEDLRGRLPGQNNAGACPGRTTRAPARAEQRGRLPGQNKKQREGLALLAATLLDVRSANLMDLAAALPRAAERTDMRYRWLSRLLANELIDADAAMAPYARELLARLAADGPAGSC
jgi:hypothetical protein